MKFNAGMKELNEILTSTNTEQPETDTREQAVSDEKDYTPKGEKQEEDKPVVTSVANVYESKKQTLINGQTELKKYSRFSFADCCKNPTPIKWLVKGYIPEQALIMMFGASGSGKSFVADDICASIACPEIDNWNGKTLKHRHVIYFAGEGTAGIKQRFAGWATRRGINPENVQLTIIDEVFNLDSDEPDYSIENTIDNIRECCENPALIVFDTLNRYMKGDENKASDVSIMLRAFNRIIHELECSVMVIHHTGVSEEAKNRVRGSSAWKGAVDVELQITKSDRIITLKQTKNKDAELEKPKVFTLDPINIPDWIDEDGEPVTTCTIEFNEIGTKTALIQKREEKTRKPKARAIETYIEAIRKFGIRIKDKESGNELAAVYIENWREISYEKSSGLSKSTQRGKFAKEIEALYGDYGEAKLLIKQTYNEKAFYCLDLNGENEADFRQAVKTAIQEHERKQAEQEKNERTGNLF